MQLKTEETPVMPGKKDEPTPKKENNIINKERETRAKNEESLGWLDNDINPRLKE